MLLARLLLEAGADSEHVRRRVEALAERQDFAAELFLGSERLLLMLGNDQVYRTRIGHALGVMGIDAGRLVALEEVATAIEAGTLELEAAAARLSVIAKARPAYPGWLTILAVAGTAAALARLFSATLPVVGAAFLAGAVSTVLRRVLPRLRVGPAAAAGITATISGMTAVLASRPSGADPTLALVAAGMILVPGVPLINGVRDLMQGHAAIGLARIANGAITVIAIAAGLAATSLAVGVHLPVTLNTPNLGLAWDLLFSSIAAFGFAILFGAPRGAVPTIMLTGALAHGLRTALMMLGSDIAIATLAGATLAGVLARLVGRRLGTPSSALAFPSVVAMVPGSYAFRGLIGALDIMLAGPAAPAALLAASAAALISAFVLTVSIGIGLLLSSALNPAIFGLGNRPARDRMSPPR
ncbi:threonine/serine exporter ThrE family protein [Novosphingobium sp. NBM11]|uniref:threonine/serine ThrE exporter family protein n=1 Tax=Novosphingobium sp. NBM11 TaxID=2596914 RepID=UPI0019D5626A|nr:threonine/serine exporter family protein [Novosphingobium sp. NBM11]